MISFELVLSSLSDGLTYAGGLVVVVVVVVLVVHKQQH